MTVKAPATTWDVYVINGKRKPMLAGTMDASKAPPCTYAHEGTTYYFATHDMRQGWVSYTNVQPLWTGQSR